MKFLAIDIQGFDIPEFTAKEITYIRGYGAKNFGHYHLMPSKPFAMLDMRSKKTVRYLENNHHGLRYSSGNIPYEEVYGLIRHLAVEVDIIYVKGCQKKLFIESIIEADELDVQIVDVGNCDMVKFSKILPHQCNHHFLKTCVCSLNNCMLLYNWILNLLPK